MMKSSRMVKIVSGNSVIEIRTYRYVMFGEVYYRTEWIDDNKLSLKMMRDSGLSSLYYPGYIVPHCDWDSALRYHVMIEDKFFLTRNRESKGDFYGELGKRFVVNWETTMLG